MVDLITLQEYKNAKGITKTDQDTVLQGLITNVSAIIQRYIGRRLVDDGTLIEQIISLDYDTTAIYLDEFPVSNVTITSIDPYSHDSTVHFPLPTTSFLVDYKDGKILRTGGYYWPQGPGAVIVTYNAGAEDEASIPVELKQVAIDLVTYYLKEEYKDSKQMRGASINNSTGSGNTNTASTNFPPHIQRVLDLF